MLARFAVPAATVALLGAAVSTASAALTAPQTISPVGQSASYPFASTNADGDAAVQWDAYTEGLQVSMRPAGGSWDAVPAQLTAPGARVAGRQVVIDSTGAATAIWGEYTTTIVGGFPTNGPVTIFTARRPAGGAWVAPEQLSTPSVNAGYLSVLAVGSDDELVALWDEGGALHSATRTPGGAWSAAASVPSASTNQTPRVAIDASGTATAAWQDASTDHVMSSTLAPGAAWTTPVDVSGVPGFVPALAMNEDGDATLVWNGGSTSQMSSRRPTTASAWSAPTQISVNGGLNYYTPSVAVDADGRATVAWSQANLVGGNVRYDQMVASRAGDGTWGAPMSLGTGSSDSLAVSAEAGGEVTVAWRGLDAQSNLVAQTATRAPGGAWSSTTDLTDLGNAYPDVSVDGDGDALFVAASSRVVTQADDRAGPRLRDLSVPTAATVGVASSFAVSPIDAWSPLATTTWDFGDGATATGAAPTHTYATAGTKTVTVTATDALTHTSTTTAAVLVAPAPADPSRRSPRQAMPPLPLQRQPRSARAAASSRCTPTCPRATSCAARRSRSPARRRGASTAGRGTSPSTCVASACAR
jgi:hypothetical protein